MGFRIMLHYFGHYLYSLPIFLQESKFLYIKICVNNIVHLAEVYMSILPVLTVLCGLVKLFGVK